MSTSKQHGFTLVELSIVLVIIGLVVAGVTAGQSLVKSAKTRSILSQVEQFRVAVHTFSLEYNAIPGDMASAYSYWGNNCDATASNCNGDGNKVLANGSGSDSEIYRFWQHLSLARLLPNSYTGIASGGTLNCVLNQNTPTGSIASSGYSANALTMGVGGSWQSISSLFLGKCVGTTIPNTALLTPTEAYSIDLKADDGNGFTGKTRAWTGISASGTCNPTGSYNISNANIACYMHFAL